MKIATISYGLYFGVFCYASSPMPSSGGSNSSTNESAQAFNSATEKPATYFSPATPVFGGASMCSEVLAALIRDEPPSLDSSNALLPGHWAVYAFMQRPTDKDYDAGYRFAEDLRKLIANVERISIVEPPKHGVLTLHTNITNVDGLQFGGNFEIVH